MESFSYMSSICARLRVVGFLSPGDEQRFKIAVRPEVIIQCISTKFAQFVLAMFVL